MTISRSMPWRIRSWSSARLFRDMRELTRAFFETILTAAYCLVFVCLAILTLPLQRLVEDTLLRRYEQTRAAFSNCPTDLPETNHAWVMGLSTLQGVERVFGSHSLDGTGGKTARGFVVWVEVRV